jgi:DNA-binding NtrC family response regulator
MPKRVLIVDDDASDRRFLEDTVIALGYPAITTGTGDAIAMLRGEEAGDIALVLVDLAACGAEGAAVLAAASAALRRKPVSVQTSPGGAGAADAMRCSAFDFIVRPVSPERLDVSLRNALRLQALEEELLKMRSAQGSIALEFFPATSEAMSRCIELARRAARSSSPLLIEGESGVGKSVLARAIHAASARAANPFVALHCAAFRASRLEDVLFGAEPASAGKLQEAAGGTLFLDGIAELTSNVQARLFSVIEEEAIHPPGLKHSPEPGVRLIAATEPSLMRLVEEGRFREDLYYRLAVSPIRVPPLRERLEELPELARSFTIGSAAELGKRVDALDAEALALLSRYDWPGNIRQLENAVFRAVVLAEGPLLSASEFPQIAAQVGGYRVTIPAAPGPRDQSPPFQTRCCRPRFACRWQPAGRRSASRLWGRRGRSVRSTP